MGRRISHPVAGTETILSEGWQNLLSKKGGWMYSLLLKLMILSAIAELGMTAKDFSDPRRIKEKTHRVLNIDWKPISLFPNEAKKFKSWR